MKEYKSPEIIFEKLEIFEKIADTCWGWGAAIFTAYDPSDPPGSPQKTVYVDFGANGCAGGNPPVMMQALAAAGFTQAELEFLVSPSNLSSLANTHSSLFVPAS
ncbi:MAG: hypothetical protein ABRQ27_03160 [Clostridiaceae bacterium]